MSVFRRMRKLKSLYAIKIGPGAAVLPPEVTRIHMDFASDVHDGHYGPRKFWRNCLPRLKYYNPAVPMTVNRTNDQLGPALMTVHFNFPKTEALKQPETYSVADKSPPIPIPELNAESSTERTEVINMKHRLDSEILEQLLKLTKAKIVEPKPEELREIKELERLNNSAVKMQIEMRKKYEKDRKEKDMLKIAKGELETMKER